MDKREYYISKYPYIVAWGQKLGSFGYYIEQQVSLAESTDAPQDACFYNAETDTWRCYSHMRDDLKAELDSYVAGKLGGVIINWSESTAIIGDKLILVENVDQWRAFLTWVENTSLYTALQNDPYGTEIRGHSPEGDVMLNLHLVRDRPINSAEDLPVEILRNFYINSPWFKTGQGEELQKLLTNEA